MNDQGQQALLFQNWIVTTWQNEIQQVPTQFEHWSLHPLSLNASFLRSKVCFVIYFVERMKFPKLTSDVMDSIF